jgi:hypothetical protein
VGFYLVFLPKLGIYPEHVLVFGPKLGVEPQHVIVCARLGNDLYSRRAKTVAEQLEYSTGGPRSGK